LNLDDLEVVDYIMNVNEYWSSLENNFSHHL
jgi:hypothetical protein